MSFDWKVENIFKSVKKILKKEGEGEKNHAAIVDVVN